MTGCQKIEDHLQKEGNISAGFGYIIVFCVKGENEGMKVVEHQLDKPDDKNHPYGDQEETGRQIILIQIGHHIAEPCQHGQKHEDKIEYRCEIKEG